MGSNGTNFQLTTADRLYAGAARVVFRPIWLTARACGATPADLRCRAGELPNASAPLVWFHGASAGEMAAAARLVAVLRERGYRFTAGYTATNRAGVEVAARAGGRAQIAALAPWDHPRWVARAFDHWQPVALLLVETELWPRLILEACRRRVPVFCVSARIYPRDLARYRWIGGVTSQMLRRLTAVLAQDDHERERLIALGAPPERCVASGNLKYLATQPPSVSETPLRDELGLRDDELVVIAGSIHTDEIDLLFAALEQLASMALATMALRVIVAPRHLSAAGAIVRESQRRHWRVVRRTAEPPASDWRVLVLDRMGELGRMYAIASVAVVGGGFGKHGGHNPLEPIMAGTPVLFGGHMDHFEPEARALTAVVPDAQVASALQLGQRLGEWLASKARRRDVLERQRQALPDGAAIARRYIEALAPWLVGCCGDQQR